MKPKEAIHAINKVDAELFNTEVQVNIRMSLSNKQALAGLAKAKGCKGISGLLKMLAKAERVEITL